MKESARKDFIKKGHMLEELIDKFFQLNGYTTHRNIILEGKSGGRHEIDILAEKQDEITSFRIMVECKAWNNPIEKDVVSKVAYVMRDLGLNKAIIVSLEGWRVGAEKSAKELGIELWGKDDIEKKLGKVSLAELETAKFKRKVLGIPPKCEEREAVALVEKESKGFLGIIKEDILWVKLVWVPCYLFRITYSEKMGLLKSSIKAKNLLNVYESLHGNFLFRFVDEPPLEEVPAEVIIQPKIKENKIKKNILKTLEKAQEVVTAKAKLRYQEKLMNLGIPPSSLSVSVDKIEEIFFPFYVALLKKGENERVVVVNAINKNINKVLGAVLTAELSYLKDILSEIRK